MDSVVVDSVVSVFNQAASQFEGSNSIVAVIVTTAMAILNRSIVLFKWFMRIFPDWGPRFSAFGLAYAYQFFVGEQTGSDLAGAGFWQGLAIVGGWEVLARPLLGSKPGGGIINNYLLPLLRRLNPAAGIVLICCVSFMGMATGAALAQTDPPSRLSFKRVAGVVGVSGVYYSDNSTIFDSGFETQLALSYSATREMSAVVDWERNWNAEFDKLRAGGRLLFFKAGRIQAFVGADYVYYLGQYESMLITEQSSWLGVTRISWAAVKSDAGRTIFYGKLGFDYDEPNRKGYLTGTLSYQFFGGSK